MSLFLSKYVLKTENIFVFFLKKGNLNFFAVRNSPYINFLRKDELN